MKDIYILEAENQFNTLVEFIYNNTNDLDSYKMESAIYKKLLQIGKEMLSHYFTNIANNDGV